MLSTLEAVKQPISARRSTVPDRSFGCNPVEHIGINTTLKDSGQDQGLLADFRRHLGAGLAPEDIDLAADPEIAREIDPGLD
jgi:hypothetical protein